MQLHVRLSVGKARPLMSSGSCLLAEGEERDENLVRADWIQEHQAGVLGCSRYHTYTSALRPHQPLLVGSVLVISKRQPLL